MKYYNYAGGETMVYDLNVLLDEVIKEYGENKGYYKPTISWSRFNQLYALGEYQYWSNAINISPFLNNKKIEKETLKSVIYHEYIHQKYSEHNSGFKKRENIFPNVKVHEKKLKDYFNEINQWPIREPKKVFEIKEEVVFCLLSNWNLDKYLLSQYNFNVYIDLDNDVVVPDEMINNLYDVIWLVKEQDLLHVIGMSNNVNFIKEKKVVSLEPISSDVFSFQATCENEATSFFMEDCCVIPLDLFPEILDTNIISESEITNFLVSDVIDNLKSYNCDIHDLGLTREAKNGIAPITEKDYNKIIKLAYKEKNGLRAVCIANKGKLLCDCFETRLCLADCLLKALLFDSALEEYNSLLLEYPNNDEIINKVNIIKAILERFR